MNVVICCYLELDMCVDGDICNILLGVFDSMVMLMGGCLLWCWLYCLLCLCEVLVQCYYVVEILIDRGSDVDICEQFWCLGDLECIFICVVLCLVCFCDFFILCDGLGLLLVVCEVLVLLDLLCLQVLYVVLGEYDVCVQLLVSVIVEMLLLKLSDGGVLVDGFDEELDELCCLFIYVDQFLVDLEQCECESSGIFILKVGYNCVYGYYIEISKGQFDCVLVYYICCQILINVECYIIEELKVFEDKVLFVCDCLLLCEKYLYEQLLDIFGEQLELLKQCVVVLSELDVLVVFVECVQVLDWLCLELEMVLCLKIECGCYLVVEVVCEQLFELNDLDLYLDCCMLVIIGLNMGGKLIYMWQNVLIVLLVYIGSFVLVSCVVIGLIDCILICIGVGDDFVCGQLIFMVEMVEISYILYYVIVYLLVLMDEIGRGIFIYDGLVLVDVVVCYFVYQNCCYMLFVIYYFELIVLVDE